MKDELVTHTTARLAQQKGFNEPCIDAYKDGILYERYEIDTMDEMTIEELRNAFEQTNSQCDAGTVTAPTQSLLQRWLRENYQILIDVESFNGDGKTGLPLEEPIFGYHITSIRITEESEDEMLYDTYEEALEVALKEGLELLS